MQLIEQQILSCLQSNESGREKVQLCESILGIFRCFCRSYDRDLIHTSRFYGLIKGLKETAVKQPKQPQVYESPLAGPFIRRTVVEKT